MLLLKIIRKITPKRISNLLPELFIRIFDCYGQQSWSQEGEDKILDKIFGIKGSGFYIDVGAHHPRRFSNTYMFYRRGWSGINIDAMPGSMNSFYEDRPRDINLEIPILKEKGEMKFYQFNEPALNGFSSEISKKRDLCGDYKIKNIINLKGLPLKSVLEKYVPNDIDQIDFMSIDVEGLDYDVIQSNDWERFRPKILLVELLDSSLSNVEVDPIYKYLLSHEYSIFAKSVQTVFFVSNEYLAERGIDKV